MQPTTGYLHFGYHQHVSHRCSSKQLFDRSLLTLLFPDCFTSSRHSSTRSAIARRTSSWKRRCHLLARFMTARYKHGARVFSRSREAIWRTEDHASKNLERMRAGPVHPQAMEQEPVSWGVELVYDALKLTDVRDRTTTPLVRWLVVVSI